MEITMKTFHDEKENSVTKSRGTLQAVCPDDPSEISINRQRSPNLPRRTRITVEKVMAVSSRVVVRYVSEGPIASSFDRREKRLLLWSD